METKVCRICGIEKAIEEYNKCPGRKCRRTECKECQAETSRKYRLNNKEELNKKHREYVKKHKMQYKEYAHNCYLKHKNKREEEKKEYYSKHKEELKQYNKKYYISNKEKIRSNINKYRKENHKIITKKLKEKRRMEPIFKLKCNIRSLIWCSFTRKEYSKNKSCEEILGCSVGYFVNHLLGTFKDNYGYEWDGTEKVHIDHKKPLKYAITEEDVIKLCHYTNLQLLKAEDNLKKGCKII